VKKNLIKKFPKIKIKIKIGKIGKCNNFSKKKSNLRNPLGIYKFWSNSEQKKITNFPLPTQKKKEVGR